MGVLGRLRDLVRRGRSPDAGHPVVFDIGDRVRLRSTPSPSPSNRTEMIGTVFGWTTPSVSGVDVIGDPSADIAVNVDFDGVSGWFTPDLLELVDHGAGGTVKIADQSFVRTESGEWLPDAAPDPDRGTEP